MLLADIARIYGRGFHSLLASATGITPHTLARGIRVGLSYRNAARVMAALPWAETTIDELCDPLGAERAQRARFELSRPPTASS